MAIHIRRRDFIAVLGGAATWPLTGVAQQRTPVVGYLSGGAPGPFASFLAAFRQGLGESGYAEGQNVAIEYRWAEGHYDRLPALATELVDRKVDLIAASGGDLAAHAAKGATSTIPIVFTSGDDPAEIGIGLTIPESFLLRADQVIEMKRREFITLLGDAAAAWPLAAHAQQAVPVIGFLHGTSPGPYAPVLPGFHQGLKEAGYTEGRNVAVEYRWAEDRYDRLPALRPIWLTVTVIAAPGPLSGTGSIRSRTSSCGRRGSPSPH